MFTGIVEEMGTLKAIRKGPPTVPCWRSKPKLFLEDIHLGDSIAVNGVCPHRHPTPPPASPPTSCMRP